MRSIKSIALLFFLIGFVGAAQAQLKPAKQVEGDPYKVHFYTLKNGLTLALTVNKSAPQIQTMIAVKAGSKHDPHDNTGLAHYLEHMLFKGTESFGTRSYGGEKPFLNRIEGLYKIYSESKDSAQRAMLYRYIDSVSYEASKVAIANEYDKMMQSLGATGTNAFTSTDQTVYINSIPTNQLEKWLKIEQDRFSHPVFRLFHTELEAVYEEKNISLDDDNDKAYDALMLGVFPTHPYGTQTTIGTIEHLKNPSLEKIHWFFDKYYKADNMALIMSGDFDPDSTYALVDKYLGKLPYSGVPIIDKLNNIPDSIDPMDYAGMDVETTVVGPNEEKVYLGFRTKGSASDDALLLYMTDMILANAQAGMLDINLNKAQKVQYAVCSPLRMKEYGMHYFMVQPKEGQSLTECRNLLLEELEKLKRGEFDENIMKAIVDNLRLDRAKNFDNNFTRCLDIMDAFTNGYDWEKFVDMPEKLEKLTKQDIIDFAKRTYIPKKRATVYKIVGQDTTIQKIPKPKITPIETNRDEQSFFVRRINEMPVSPIPAVFPDFKTAIQTTTYGSGKKAVNMEYVNNAETDYFTLYIRFDMGTNANPWLQHYADYIPYIATQSKTNEQISREFFTLACEFGFVANTENSYIYLKGLNKNFTQAYALLTEVFTNAKVEDQKWQNLVADILKSRQDAKTNKSTILRKALNSYARYGGKKSPFTNIVSQKDLQGAKAETIQKDINGLLSYAHNVWYYGPTPQETLATQINSLLQPEGKLKKAPKNKKYKAKGAKKPIIYFVPYDMVQAEVIWQHPIEKFGDDKIAAATVFNEYFGGGMYSLVFQTIRESKALAYSAYANITLPTEAGKPAFATAYVGTQADKLINAMKGMTQLMDSIPADRMMGEDAKEAVRKQIESERITGQSLLTQHNTAEKLGLEEPLSQWIYQNLQGVNYEALKTIQSQAYTNQTFAICLIASKENIDFDALKTFGKVKELSLEDIFGY